MPEARLTLRLDKWLVFARVAKTRGTAAALVEAGHVRVNGQRVQRPAHPVGPGDTLTLPQGARIRLLRILFCGTRRGPAAEAAALYLDLDAPPPETPVPQSPQGPEHAS
ncbi:RNA-binding S4 domain-containing protein [Frigidibacter albus]|uniref:RNA-binding S4 domain-containing protein n=1 Tax=Frigidibacter albus TaxID=1465486 RepID=A0A6L8VJK5_9RHOB|nr:RNA-binding S4 domain-containing protein [Frigidibacter albus]MZQ89762.1 RNA-binding S4 domain-containing protein [Frigidibacter albus]NBE31863.1 RNA-binding S4 domain-containing protein [Frigidibacter albus]GGH56797.1 heat-shock protein Hsp15 [Frigidibacter albus]